MHTKIGVVTVTYNSAGVIDDFMRSTLSQSHQDFVLYVIDNASADQTLAMLSHYSDARIQVTANAKNVGVAEGNNQGILEALARGCDYVLLLNNDTEFDRELFAALLEAIDANGAEMLVPKIMFYDRQDRIWCAGGYFRRWLGYSTGHCGEGQLDEGQFDSPRAIDYAPTCCMLIRSEVFRKIGMMDPRYFVYYDDTDFCWRARTACIRLCYDPRGKLYHKVSSLTGGLESDFTVQYANRNRVYFVLKNLRPWQIAYCLMLYQVIFLAKLLCGRDSRRIYALKMRSYFQGIELRRTTK